MSTHRRASLALAVAFVLCSAPALASEPESSTLDTIEVTSSKLPLALRDSAASVSVVSGDELRARGANDLRTALSLVVGVDVAPGGDGGPAASVPALWGLREFDAFLLVVDGVPWGGAFVPALATLNLANVERIEVLKGAAPVSYGATSFVGVIHVIHHAAGQGSASIEAGVGSRGNANVALLLPLSNTDAGIASSLLFDAEKRELSADRTGYDRSHLLYRLAAAAGEGKFTLDLDGTVLHQDPASPHPREGRTLSSRFPIDANVNPRDGKIDENRVQLALGYLLETGWGEWDTRLAAARSDGDITRGFLRSDFAIDGSTVNADGYRQNRDTRELYFDSHLTTRLSDRATVVWGLDHMHGEGEQESSNFEYAVLPNGRNAPDSHSLRIDEATELEDRRNFSGAYADLHLAPTEAWRVEIGARFNRTRETRAGAETVFNSNTPAETESEQQKRNDTRWSGAIGTSYRLWQDGSDGVHVFANYRNAFKPAVIDFGPEAESNILEPEYARSVELGAKGEHAGGRFDWELSLFRMNFRNLVVAQNVNGSPGLTNAGNERFRGAEFEARYALTDTLDLHANYAYHDARFTDYAQLFGSTLTQLRGKQLELSPQHLGALGLLYLPQQGFNASIVASYVGKRFLNKRNTAPTGAYTAVDAGVGYRFETSELRLDGYNLSDRRDPVAESELGDAQYYRMPSRTYQLSFRYNFGAK